MIIDSSSRKSINMPILNSNQSNNTKYQNSTNEKESIENSNESAKDSRILQGIKSYKYNEDDKTQTNGKNFNSIA